MDPSSSEQSHVVADAIVTRVVFLALGIGLILVTLFEPSGVELSWFATVWAWCLGAWLVFCGWVYGRPEIWGVLPSPRPGMQPPSVLFGEDRADETAPSASPPNVVQLRRPPNDRQAPRHS